jgi:hypothetical protein
MLKEQTPVWVWDGFWWPAYVVLPVLDLESDTMLVRFENGVTAPAKGSSVRPRDSKSRHINQRHLFWELGMPGRVAIADGKPR